MPPQSSHAYTRIVGGDGRSIRAGENTVFVGVRLAEPAKNRSVAQTSPKAPAEYPNV